MARQKELADLSLTDLREQLGETKQELFNLRFQNVTGQLDTTPTPGAKKSRAAEALETGQ